MTAASLALRNLDPTRAWARGLLGEAVGPSPYKCWCCEADSRYGRDGVWYCSEHWQDYTRRSPEDELDDSNEDDAYQP